MGRPKNEIFRGKVFETIKMINMKYRLFNGDCLEEHQHIEDGAVDLILCDLPFGTMKMKEKTEIIKFCILPRNGMLPLLRTINCLFLHSPCVESNNLHLFLGLIFPFLPEKDNQFQTAI
jgi:hypothetical protein